jgi:hypothetical protein
VTLLGDAAVVAGGRPDVVLTGADVLGSAELSVAS